VPAKERNQNPVVGDELTLRLFTYNSNHRRPVDLVEKVEVFRIDPSCADEDNPEGYWEWEDVKKLPKDTNILKSAGGKAVKVISALLPALPRAHRYKIIYMTRPVEQVVASQFAMLERQGQAPKREAAHLAKLQEEHSAKIREVLKKGEQVEMLEVNYPDLVADPAATIAKVADFLGERFHNRPAVAAVVKPKLHRQR